MSTLASLGVISFTPRDEPPRRTAFVRLRRFLAGVRWLLSRDSEASWRRWFDLPCDRCGGTRNYRVSGHFQVVCFHCASGRKLRIRVDALVRDAEARRN